MSLAAIGTPTASQISYVAGEARQHDPDVNHTLVVLWAKVIAHPKIVRVNGYMAVWLNHEQDLSNSSEIGEMSNACVFAGLC